MNCAVIFDMDGLLIDSEPLWVKAEIDTFKDVGIILNKTLCAQTMGLRIDEAVSHWYQKKPWDHISQKTIEEKIIRTVMNLIQSQGKRCEGVPYILNFFKEKKIPIALASSSGKKIIDTALISLQITHYFDHIISAENEMYGKPHPGVFMTTANKLGIRPEHCLVFEDSFNGVIAAKAAKMKVVAVPEKEQLKGPISHVADITIPSLKEFSLSCFDRLFPGQI